MGICHPDAYPVFGALSSAERLSKRAHETKTCDVLVSLQSIKERLQCSRLSIGRCVVIYVRMYVCTLCSFYRALVSRDDCAKTGLEQFLSLCYALENESVGLLQAVFE
jgi:hypothetical protein